MNTPRRKRLNRKNRLDAARIWLQGYNGEKVVCSYRKYFGVDWLSAFKELEILGVSIPAQYRESIIKSLVSTAAAKKQKKAEKLLPPENLDQDDNFAFIAGYTNGGAPYGITWDEWKQIETG
jgi:hypothetical protein